MQISKECYSLSPDLASFTKKSDFKWWNHVSWKEIDRASITEKNYWPRLCDFIAYNEGCVNYGYADGQAGYSIGYGLLFKENNSTSYRKTAVDLFQQALGLDLYKFIPLEVFNRPFVLGSLKQYKLTNDQCMRLLYFTLEEDERLIKNKISLFQTLSLNMKIAIHSLWYNFPSLIGPKFMEGLSAYIRSRKLKYLLDCLYEIENNSNPKESSYYFGVRNRRLRESLMFSNRALDFAWRIEARYFDNFIEELKKDMSDLYDRFLLYYEDKTSSFSFQADSSTDASISVNQGSVQDDKFTLSLFGRIIKQGILDGYFEEEALPNLEYIIRKLKK